MGRRAGIRNGERIFDPLVLKRIRKLYSFHQPGRTHVALARIFGCSQATIFRIVNHIPPYDIRRGRKKEHQNGA
jgi:Mor family transcriptional regulator